MYIACDEAGHTGPDLLSTDQRFFAFASVNISDDEAWQIIKGAREAHPVQMPELKASKLMASGQGQKLISHIVQKLEGRFAITADDKLLALCGWAFEYIFEPVFQDNPRIFYQKDFHRFIAMFFYLWLQDPESDAATAIAQFQSYMRTKDISLAPILFEHKSAKNLEQPHPFELIQRFATGFRDLISKDNATLDHVAAERGKWTLDLSAASLWSHLNHWGRERKPLVVICDNSKPLLANIDLFSGEDDDAAIQRARYMFGDQSLGWKLSEPISFVDSRAHPSIQLADILASTAVSVFSNGLPKGMENEAAIMEAGMLRDSIFPDFERVDLSTDAAAVNYAVLYELAMTSEGRGTGAPIDIYWALAEQGVADGHIKFKNA